jgi:protein-tyrosine phosphatase
VLSSRIRDLGGLPTLTGQLTKERAVFRSGSLDDLTAAEWAEVWNLGIRTIVDLRHPSEKSPKRTARPKDLEVLGIELDPGLHDQDTHVAFWTKWKTGAGLASPLYYENHLETFPETSAAVLRAIGHASPGGVLVHCGRGRDRTGLVCVLLLSLSGVKTDAIIENYEWAASRSPEAPKIRAELEQLGTSTEKLLRDLLTKLDVPQQLLKGGLAPRDIAAIQTRLVR